MEKFYLEEPSICRKEEVIEYVKEHFKYNSKNAGMSGLEEDYKNYELWLEKMKLQGNSETCPSDRCCGVEYFLIRESDNKLVGMINLRWNLNEWMLRNGGHIGYNVRPLERRKGYNKINLYLGLLKAKEIGLDRVLLTADEDNFGSLKTIQALGGILENRVTNYQDETKLMERYWINVDESIERYYEYFKNYIRDSEKVRK